MFDKLLGASAITRQSRSQIPQSSRDLVLRPDDLLTNPATRVAVCLVLDTSASMAGRPIEELYAGLRLFVTAVAADEDACNSCDVAVVTVGAPVKTLCGFGLARSVGPELSVIEARGETPLGLGIETALNLLDARKMQYRQAGTPYYQPWLVIFTDGHPTDDTAIAEGRVQQAVEDRKLTVIPVGIGWQADLPRLQRLAGGILPKRLEGLNFKAFFRWLSASIANVSRSAPGQSVRTPNPFEWIST